MTRGKVLEWIKVTEKTNFPTENDFLLMIKEDSFLEVGLFYCYYEPLGYFSLFPIKPSTCCAKDYLKFCAQCSKSRWIFQDELIKVSNFYLSIPNQPERLSEKTSKEDAIV